MKYKPQPLPANVMHMEELMTMPAGPVQWAENAHLDNMQRDCITAVVLKVLDAKCKMPAEQQEAVLAIYDTLEVYSNGLFGPEVHSYIDQARGEHQLDESLRDHIHQLRLEAEANIAKPVMKAFKARLRHELFVPNS